MRDISALIQPASVAVVGASSKTSKPGGALLKNVIDGGYQGRIFPVNPNAQELHGLAAFPSVRELPEPVDLAFIATPQSAIESVIADCATLGIRAVCIISAGFAEAGETGRLNQDRIFQLLDASGIAGIGPNTIGLINSDIDLMGSYARFTDWLGGGVSICAQTGIFAGAAVAPIMAREFQRIGIGKSIDLGNRIDVDEIDFLEFAADDRNTKVIGIYAESLTRPRQFLQTASRVSQEKPIVLLKPGRTEPGARAAISHTGSIITEELILDSVARQNGLIRVEDVEEFLDALRILSYSASSNPKCRVGVLTYSGALGVIAIDQLTEAGLAIASPSAQTLNRIKELMPAWQPANHPVDAMLSVEVAGFSRGTEEPLRALLADPGVDVVLAVLYTPTTAGAFADLQDSFKRLRDEFPNKPIVMVVFGTTYHDSWVSQLEGLRIPVFSSTRAAVSAIRAVSEHQTKTSPLEGDGL